MEPQEPSLRVRINQIDYILNQAGALDNTSLPRVPIIRIYGDSSVGKKTCLHVHQVYPYFFVEYAGKLKPDSVNRHIAKLTHSLNHAIAVSARRDPNSPRSQFVRAIILVKGVHFYGFHSSYSPFLKVHMVDPGFINRAVTLLQSGTIMKTRFRVYESHLSFILQFLCDFGLYGCGWIDLAEVWKRGQDDVFEEQLEQADGTDNSQEQEFHVSPYHRQTRMPLELDVGAHQILNRLRLSPRNVHHKLTIPAPPLPSDPVVISVRELWDDERRRRAARGLSPSPVIPKDLSERSRGVGGDWVAEARWWEELRKRIVKEQELQRPPRADEGWERWVMTTFESVEVLWEKQYRVWRPSISTSVQVAEPEVNPYGDASMDSQQLIQPGSVNDVDVDENMLASQELSRLVEQEEDEWKEREGDLGEDDRQNDDNDAMGDIPEDMQYDESPVKAPQTPSKTSVTPQETPTGRSNPLRGIWNKLAGPGITLPHSRALTTPSKRKRSNSPHRLPSTSGGHVASDLTLGGPVEDPSENPFLDSSTSASRESSVSRSVIGDGADVYDQVLDMIVEEDEASSGSVGSAESPNGTPEVSESKRVSSGHEDLSEGPARKRRKLDTNTNPRSPPHRHRLIKAAGTALTRLPMSKNVKTCSYLYTLKPPTSLELTTSADLYDIPSKIYRVPYYSLESDAPERPREYAGLVYDLKGGTGIANLEEWASSNDEDGLEMDLKKGHLDIYGWEYAGVPPGLREVRKWLEKNKEVALGQGERSSQIVGPTQALGDFKIDLHATAPREKGNMTVLSLEVFAPCSGQGLPDPGTDPVVAVFYAFYDSNYQRVDRAAPFVCMSGVITLRDGQLDQRRLRDWDLDEVETELELLNRVIDVVHEFDPDIITGWEVQTASWGFLNARGRTFDLDFAEHLSRAPGRPTIIGTDQWGVRTSSTFKVVGRHVLNLWRIMRAENALSSYTLENVVFHLLQRRIPRYSAQTLTKWYNSNVPAHASRLISYFASRTATVLEIIEVAEVVTKNSEFARVFGIDFFSVFSRGSQFKVESFMFRIAKPESFVLLSPSKQDVGKQNAAECMPLIMEPLSAFYSGPLLVLDFQSLYPSIMIAYNYCYSTCLGRVTEFKGQNKFGVTDLRQPPGLLDTLQDSIHVSPNGMIFVKPEVRKGLLGRMLTELLDTRVMIKTAMKGVKSDKALQRVLEARQLAMKFIANVTYGYTSASFSGRMPAVEIADAIVQSGRETLEKAIKVIDTTPKWGARVVYGDTDSLFIYLKGKTKEQAFRIGQDIADRITAMNPAPVKLKFEKVYLPCVLLAKKRYVGFKFESPDDQEPVFDAKGIETVRRDGVPAQQKMTETCLKILFRTQDLSQVREYCCDTWTKILDNKASTQDFIFAKEVKLGTYSDLAPPPPGVAVAARKMLEDPNDEPQYGDRIPYVIARGPPGTRLIDRAVAPEVLLNDSHKHLDGVYYISRVLLPPLERIFNLVGADVRAWYDEMAKPLRADETESLTFSPKKMKQETWANKLKIEEHFYASRCLTCGSPCGDSLCDDCLLSPQETISGLLSRVRKTERHLSQAHRICVSCSGVAAAEPIDCESLDCPWLFERKKLERKAESLDHLGELVDEVIAMEDFGSGEEDEAKY